MSLASAVNFTLFGLLGATALGIAGGWTFGRVSDATYYFWVPKLAMSFVACCGAQIAIHWWEGGYRRGDGNPPVKGFPVQPRRDEHDASK